MGFKVRVEEGSNLQVCLGRLFRRQSLKGTQNFGAAERVEGGMTKSHGQAGYEGKGKWTGRLLRLGVYTELSSAFEVSREMQGVTGSEL